MAGLATALVIGLAATAGLAQEQAQDQQAPAQPQNEFGPTFQAWQIVCQTTTPRTCGALQEVRTADGRLALWSAFGFFRPDAPMVMLLRMPYELTDPPSTFSVATDLTIAIDGNEVTKVPIEVCGPQICESGFVLSDQMVSAMKAGNAMKVSMILGNGARADMTLSLSGFTAAYNELTKE